MTETNTESYKLKVIKFFGREVPVVVQNDNGPCPLLAISNILLLRNQMHLPLGLPDVRQVITVGSPSSDRTSMPSCSELWDLLWGWVSCLEGTVTRQGFAYA